MEQLSLSLYSKEEELRVIVNSSVRKLEHSDVIILNERLVSSRISSSGKPNLRVWLYKYNDQAKAFLERVSKSGLVVEYQIGKPVEPKPVKKTKKRVSKKKPVSLTGEYLKI